MKELTKEIKESLSIKSGELGNNTYRALGLYTEGKNHKIARFDFNPETKVVEFVSVEDASRIPEARHMAKFSFEKIIFEEVFKKLEENDV